MGILCSTLLCTTMSAVPSPSTAAAIDGYLRDAAAHRSDAPRVSAFLDAVIASNGAAIATPEQRQQAQDRAAQSGAQTRDRATTSQVDSATRSQVDRDAAARAEGAQRTRDSGQMRSGSTTTTSRSGSYRPSGGGRPAGGGGRRR